MVSPSRKLTTVVARLVRRECVRLSSHVGWHRLLLGVCLIAVIMGRGRSVRAEEKAAATADGLSDLSKSYLRFGPTEYVNLFEPGTFRAGEDGSEGPILRYRLFIPRDIEAGKKYPLIVWVHGFGVEETIDVNRNTGQLMHTGLIFKTLNTPADYRFYFLAPQNQESADWFAKPRDRDDDAMSWGEMLLALVDEMIAKQSVDPDRVTMVGISSGATASWGFAARRPDLFAGVAPISGIGARDVRLEQLVDIPVWAFHNKGDKPEGDIRSVERLQSLGGCAQVTIPPDEGHDSWSAAFARHELLTWLLARRKGESCPSPAEKSIQRIDVDTERVTSILIAAATLFAFVAAVACLIRPPALLKRLLTSSR